jgi:uncharacterized membrane protein YgcG
MSLEGLRAWIGEVERKLGKRTRVFLALTVIAIGIAGAAVYLAIDARESSVSESDVQALQEKLETRIDEVSGGTAALPGGLETAPETAPPAETKPKSGGKKKNGGGGGTSGGASGGGTSGGASSGSPDLPEGATGGAASSAKLQELLQQAKERSAENE